MKVRVFIPSFFFFAFLWTSVGAQNLGILDFKCGTPAEKYPEYHAPTAQERMGSLTDQVVTVSMEVDYGTYHHFNDSPILAYQYCQNLFNQVQKLYKNDSISIRLGGVYIWTTPDDPLHDKSVLDFLTLYSL